MPAQCLIFDSRIQNEFESFGTVETLESGLSRIRFEAAAESPALKQTILAANERKHTAFYLPIKSWKAIFYDMDSTVIAEESINELARSAGKEAEVALITEQAMAGLLDFKAALKERVRMLRGQPQAILIEAKAGLTINPGMSAVSALAQQLGIKLYLVSGGFNALAAPVAKELTFAGYLANELEAIDGVLTGELSGAIVNGEAKAQFLRDTCHRLTINLADTLAIGDGANDLPMMRVSGGGRLVTIRKTFYYLI